MHDVRLNGTLPIASMLAFPRHLKSSLADATSQGDYQAHS